MFGSCSWKIFHLQWQSFQLVKLLSTPEKMQQGIRWIVFHTWETFYLGFEGLKAFSTELSVGTCQKASLL